MICQVGMFETKYIFQAGIETYTVNTQKIAWPIGGPQLVRKQAGVFSEVMKDVQKM